MLVWDQWQTFLVKEITITADNWNWPQGITFIIARKNFSREKLTKILFWKVSYFLHGLCKISKKQHPRYCYGLLNRNLSAVGAGRHCDLPEWTCGGELQTSGHSSWSPISDCELEDKATQKPDLAMEVTGKEGNGMTTLISFVTCHSLHFVDFCISDFALYYIIKYYIIL